MGTEACKMKQEHELLDIVLEAITAFHAQHAGPERWLRTRAWEGNSHIGNRPEQPHAYYDITRKLRRDRASRALTLCEVGFNGGHSAALFLSAAGRKVSRSFMDIVSVCVALQYSAAFATLLVAVSCENSLALSAVQHGGCIRAFHSTNDKEREVLQWLRSRSHADEAPVTL